METFAAIRARRSHRSFAEAPLDPDLLDEVLAAGLLAPSPKNRQPWQLTIAGPQTRARVASLLEQRLSALTAAGENPGSLSLSLQAIRGCGALVFVYNRCAAAADYPRNRAKCDVLAIGACIENILLAAEARGLGVLWIGDILLAERELDALLQESGELMAALAIGHPLRQPPANPRLGLDRVCRRTP